jgi:hypothetical protein
MAARMIAVDLTSRSLLARYAERELSRVKWSSSNAKIAVISSGGLANSAARAESVLALLRQEIPYTRLPLVHSHRPACGCCRVGQKYRLRPIQNRYRLRNACICHSRPRWWRTLEVTNLAMCSAVGVSNNRFLRTTPLRRTSKTGYDGSCRRLSCRPCTRRPGLDRLSGASSSRRSLARSCGGRTGPAEA